MTFRVDFSEPIAYCRAASREIPFITSLALNRTAQDVKREEVAVMRQVFDRPTPFTLNSLQIWPSTRASLTAEIGFKAGSNRRRRSGWEILGPHIEGGGRVKRWSEIKIFDNYYVPTSYAPKDQYGNFPASEVLRIMSQLSLLEDRYMNRSNSKRSLAKRQNLTYFRQGLVMGENAIFMIKPGAARAYPILVEVSRAPQYGKRFPYFEMARRVIEDRLAANWKSAAEYALAHPKRK